MRSRLAAGDGLTRSLAGARSVFSWWWCSVSAAQPAQVYGWVLKTITNLVPPRHGPTRHCLAQRRAFYQHSSAMQPAQHAWPVGLIWGADQAGALAAGDVNSPSPWRLYFQVALGKSSDATCATKRGQKPWDKAAPNC